MDAIFTITMIDGREYLKWEQVFTKYLRIWKAKTSCPYVKYNGMKFYLTENQKKELKALGGR